MSVSYLGLTREAQVSGQDAGWQSWYRYFPWEDHRAGPPAMLEGIRAALRGWADTPGRRQRVAITFGQEGRGGQEDGAGQEEGGGQDGRAWNEELVLQRYELLFEAGLVAERVRRSGGDGGVGEAMALDHRRILATGIARLRTKIKYRPVFFELMAESFTLLQLQRTVEALAGRRLHKQNFRRLIDAQDLVEETGGVSLETGGRPAKLFRFRGGVQEERAIAGTKLPLLRS